MFRALQKFLTAVSEVFTVLEAGPDPTQVRT